MTLLRHSFPAEHRSERRFSEASRLVKPAEQFHVRDNVSDFERAKIMIGHEIEMCLDLLCIIRAETNLN